MAKIIVNLNELKETSFYRNYIEKAKKGEMVGGKYMYREEVPEKVKTSKGKTTVIRYKYYYLTDMLKDSAEKLLENIGKFFFKGNEKEVKKIENSYKTQNIEKDYGADKKTWYQHCMEYLSHKAKWDKRFSNKDNAEKFKTPIKQKVAEKVDIPGMETAAEETPEIKTTIETEKKEATWKPNPSLMRKVWSLYNGVESVNNGVSVGDTVNFNGRKGTVTKKVNDNMVMVSFEDGGLGRFFTKDLNKVDISNESVTNEADVNGKIQEVVTGLNTSNDTVEETKENLTNIFNSTNNGVAKQLREKFNSITNEYLGTKFVNKKTGIQAEFSTTSQKELRSRLENSKRNGFTIQEHFELANKIKELFENASLEKKHKDNKNNDENVNIERFLSEPVVLSTGKKVQACITVKHILNKDGHYVYSLETMDIKNALEKTRAKGGDHIGDSPNTYNNTTNIENVNSEHGNKIAMLGNQNAKKNFVDFIDKFITNGYKSDKVVNLLDTTPSILQEHGIPNNPISITPSVLKKILENDLNVYHGHNISIDILKDLPNQLENPVYILKGKDGKKIIVTEYYVENRPIITILEIDRKEGRTNVNSVRSLYDKQNDVFMEWIKDDSIVEYENKEKSKVLLQSIGNQYTKEVTTPYINNNTTNIENVNSEHGNKIAMLGNDNAKKYGLTDDDISIVKRLVDKYNFTKEQFASSAARTGNIKVINDYAKEHGMKAYDVALDVYDIIINNKTETETNNMTEPTTKTKNSNVDGLSLNTDLIANANNSSYMYEAGDAINREYLGGIEAINSWDLTDEEKQKAKQKLFELTTEQLKAQAKAISVTVAGPARKVSGSDTAFDKVQKIRGKIKELLDTLRAKNNANVQKQEMKDFTSAATEAMNNNKLAFVYDGKVYYRGNTKSSSWSEINHIPEVDETKTVDEKKKELKKLKEESKNLGFANPEKTKILDRIEKLRNEIAYMNTDEWQNRHNAMLGNQNAKKQFSDLTQEEKQQKKEQIQNNIVSSIQKDSVPYNNDGAFDKAAKTWLEKNNVGNAETVIGEVIINRRSVERDMHHGDLADKYLKLQTLPAVKDVLEKGTYLGYERDFEGKNISNHYFAAKINYGNEEKIVFCRVRETDGSEERFYVHEVFTEDEIKKGTNLVPTVGRLPQLTGKLLYNFILQEVLNVNSEHGNSTVMLGNDNAHKDFADIEDDKQEFNYLISRYNELTKEFSSNGGYSNRRTTKEQDEKRRAAQRGLREIEKDLNDFREKVKEKNKGSFKIPEVYKDSLNEWIKRKVKGQTVSDEWLSKKFGGYYSDALSFGDDYLLSLGDTENINNPSVRINYKDNFGYTRYVSVDIADIDKDQYRPRFMPNDDTNFTEVWKKIQTLKEQLDNTTGSTMAEKFFNLSMGISNAYNENSKTPNIPRYRFTKDGIKDKNGKLEKINASVRDVGTENEHIQLYADSYGTSIPSIFYPENNTDTQTDYFEKDSCAVFPDHPYYNHLKIMALKARLYRGRATKWNAMTKEEQSKVEEQIKNLENQLVEPTEEDLKAYREKRDKQEEIKAKEKEERLAKYYKEKEEKEKRDLERYNKVVNLMRTDIGSFLEKDAKYKLENKTYTNIGLSENKTPILISVEDGERIEFDSLEEYVQLLLNGELEKVSDIEEYNNRSQAMMGNDNAARFRIVHPKEVVEKETVEVNDVEHTNDTNQNNNELVVPIPTVDTKTVERINENSMLGNAGNVYQHDVRVEMENFKNKFNYNNMNPQQKAYFKERVADYSSLVGSSYNEMASKRLSAGPSWVVAGPAKYNTKRFQQKTDSERRAYETFSEKKEKFIKNTEKKLKELEYSGGTESVEDVKQKVFDDYSQGKYSYGEKIENTDPYAIEKIKGKIKYMEDAHDVTLIYNKMCKKNGITNWQWTDRTDEDKAKRKEVLKQTIEEAKGKGYSDKVIKQGIEHPFGSNQTADIRRNKQRLEELEKRQQKLEERKVAESNSESVSNANIGRVDFDGGYIYENPELDRIQIIYDGKPERDVIDKLKHNGFRWSPSNKAWQRQLNRNGRMAVNRVLEETGINTKIDIDGAGEIKKSIPLFFTKNGRFYIRKS